MSSAIEKLSTEILELIFSFLPLHQMDQLVLVSKRFNEVIGGSIQLMEAFDVQWQKNKELDMRPLLESQRKYRSISVIETVSMKPTLDRFISTHANTLTHIYLYECAMTTNELKEILTRIAAQVKIVGLCGANFSGDEEIEPINFPKLEWLEIMYGGDGYVSVLKLFIGAKVKHLTYEDSYEMDTDEMANFKEFLLSLHDLKELHISNNVVPKLFVNEDFSNATQFQLEDVAMWFNSRDSDTVADATVYANSRIFLNRQRDSLKKIMLGHCTIDDETLACVANLSLKDVAFVDTEFVHPDPQHVVNQTIQCVFISSVNNDNEWSLCDMFETFINLKSLKFACCKISFEVAMTMAYHMPQLTSLEFYQCTFKPITYHTVKKLHIINCDLNTSINLIRVNRQLTSLTVPCKFRRSASFIRALHELSLSTITYK